MKQVHKLIQLMRHFPEIKLLYLFGSQARQQIGNLSDYDFAVYLDRYEKKAAFRLKQKLIIALSALLSTNDIDVVILNELHNSEMKYFIITEGDLLYYKEPYTTLVEPRILNEYFDFHTNLRQHRLTAT